MCRKLTKIEILDIAKKCKTKTEFLNSGGGAYKASKHMGIFEQATSHMPKNSLSIKDPHNKKWTEETIRSESSKYKNRYQLKKNNCSAFNAAKKLNLLDILYPIKCEFRNIAYTIEEVISIAKKYNTKSELKEANPYVYRYICKNNLNIKTITNLPEHISSEKDPHNKKWYEENLRIEALKYKTRSEFQKNSGGAYEAAVNLKIKDDICTTMGEPLNTPYELQELKEKALKHKTRSKFIKNEKGAYNSSNKKGILNDICSHMTKSNNTSSAEQNLFNNIQKLYPKTQKLRIRKKNLIGNKPHINGFDLDIYIPELRKGIEFDGKYWHSIEGLKRSRDHWPVEDVINYHKIKDDYFLSKNIQILHIDENDWNEDSKKCIDLCLEFLKL